MPVKLSETDVADLRDDWLTGMSTVTLAENYGVTERHARRLVEGRFSA